MDLAAALANHPRFPLLDGPTPIQRLTRIEQALGDAAQGIALYAKRDDAPLVGGGGNKLRKLEYLLGAAIADGADTFVTVGARQSNHARLSAAAAARAGLTCELVLTRSVPREDVDYTDSGNILLDDLFGATIHDLPGSVDSLAYAEARAETLRRAGRKVHVAPSGGSSPLGCLGYAACAGEIVAQSAAMGIDFSHVIVPNGSAGTHAGLAAGYAALGRSPAVVTSFAVLAEESRSHQETVAKASATLALIDPAAAAIDPADIDVNGSERGPGYGIPTFAMIEAVRMMARCEGLLLDPVYSGKAFAGLIAGIRAGDFAPGSTILYVMTGGTPGLFAYRGALRAGA
ncbi:D-cysteine desulfhydrase family protein [Sphingomonas sp.]|uniref:D-cysteine desulfhydrase family protein n=1 Tax=Sphingomonas sp. TaxID=28214 RepID=UPI002BFAFE5A|nr:D-cysteine desulfhydrase family protein [Sphingomonas sp.]HWK35075.1 D-cysteine desulfhydrase family protein [Sphingomonas sp.]